MGVLPVMKVFEYSFIVSSELDNVWKFYTTIDHLERITPRGMGLQVIKVSPYAIDLQQDMDLWLSARLFGIRRRWHSKITALKKYEYTDEMVSGPFKRWRHVHRFSALGNSTTSVADRVEFELPYGVIGTAFEDYALGHLCRIFAHRRLATVRILESIK